MKLDGAPVLFRGFGATLRPKWVQGKVLVGSRGAKASGIFWILEILKGKIEVIIFRFL